MRHTTLAQVISRIAGTAMLTVGRKQSKPKPRTQTAASVKGSRIVSATEAARSFSELLDRVYYRRKTFVIERRDAHM
jgi:hypothetical protein